MIGFDVLSLLIVLRGQLGIIEVMPHNWALYFPMQCRMPAVCLKDAWDGNSVSIECHAGRWRRLRWFDGFHVCAGRPGVLVRCACCAGIIVVLQSWSRDCDPDWTAVCCECPMVGFLVCVRFSVGSTWCLDSVDQQISKWRQYPPIWWWCQGLSGKYSGFTLR